MGLDITAYKKLTLVPENEGFDDEGDPLKGEFGRFYVNPSFPGRADDIEHKQAYRYEDCVGFSAGSYSGYNHWREKLAQLAGYPPTEYVVDGTPCCSAACWAGASGPFSELINFSDCEGVIGAKVSAKLAVDFATFQEQADKQDEWFRGKYDDWRNAFEMASVGGAVKFH